MPIIISILVVLALLLAGMRLSERLGYPFWYGMFMAVPVANLVVLGYFAFRRSPTEEKLEALEQELERMRASRILPSASAGGD